jgi:large subunit ribosomal protein L24
MKGVTMDEGKSKTKKLRTGDRVVVLAGNAKGQNGVLAAVLGEKVIVGGVNLGSKHVKRSKENPQGGRIEIERPIHISNVCACDENGKALKLHVRENENKERELCYEVNGELVVWRSMKRAKK